MHIQHTMQRGEVTTDFGKTVGTERRRPSTFKKSWVET